MNMSLTALVRTLVHMMARRLVKLIFLTPGPCVFPSKLVIATLLIKIIDNELS